MKSIPKKLTKAALGAVIAVSSVGALVAPASPVSAAVIIAPFTSAQCDPNTHRIIQSVEFALTGNETVAYRVFVERNGVFFPYDSNWYWASNRQPENFVWNALPGEYRVWVQYGVWNPTQRQYSYYNYQVTALQTLGRQDGYFYYGGMNGRCMT